MAFACNMIRLCLTRSSPFAASESLVAFSETNARADGNGIGEDAGFAKGVSLASVWRIRYTSFRSANFAPQRWRTRMMSQSDVTGLNWRAMRIIVLALALGFAISPATAQNAINILEAGSTVGRGFGSRKRGDGLCLRRWRELVGDGLAFECKRRRDAGDADKRHQWKYDRAGGQYGGAWRGCGERCDPRGRGPLQCLCLFCPRWRRPRYHL